MTAESTQERPEPELYHQFLVSITSNRALKPEDVAFLLCGMGEPLDAAEDLIYVSDALASLPWPVRAGNDPA